MGYVTKKAAQRFEEKKAAIYVRVSTQYQVDRASLPVQREELINYAKIGWVSGVTTAFPPKNRT